MNKAQNKRKGRWQNVRKWRLYVDFGLMCTRMVPDYYTCTVKINPKFPNAMDYATVLKISTFYRRIVMTTSA